MVEFGVRPYFLQPYSFRSYFGKELQVWPKEISREYYLSFEDALWDLLPRFGYKKGCKILLPIYYCEDVIKNIKEHGYEVSFYDVNDDLSLDFNSVTHAIETERPDVFVLLDIAGIPSELESRIERKLPFYALLILDKVHSIVTSKIENYPKNGRQLILTSTRKVAPFFGSLALFTRPIRPTTGKVPLAYTSLAIAKWLWYFLVLRLSIVFNSVSMAIYAETLLTRHDDLIGDSMVSAPLSRKFLHIVDRLAGDRIFTNKTAQVEIYESMLSSILKDSEIVTAHNYNKSKGELRGFPLIIPEKYSKSFILDCRENGLLVFKHLSDSAWTADKNLYLLPLGPHLSPDDIQNIAEIARKALTRALQYDNITA